MINTCYVRLIALIFALTILVNPLLAQMEGSAGLPKNRAIRTPDPVTQARFLNDQTIIFEVRALANAKADGYLAIFNITQLGTSAIEANELLQARYDIFLKGAMDAGIKRENIVLDMISQFPIYEYEVIKKVFSETMNEKPIGMELQKNIHVNFTHPDQLDQIVAAAAHGEIYDLVKVEYFVENNQEYYSRLRKKSVEFLNQKIEDYALLGIDLDSAHRVMSEASSVVYPFERYQGYQGYSSITLEARKKRTNINNVRKPQTRYYNKLDYKPFEIILNPMILEPAVQFTYHLQVKFTIKGPTPHVQVVTKNQTTFMLLTPEGKLQQLKIE